MHLLLSMGAITIKAIPKFERDMLHGEHIHLHKKHGVTQFKKHWHNYFEIIYYEHCVGHCLLNGARHELSDSCLFLLTPKDFHEIVTEERADSHSVILSFGEQAVDKHLRGVLTAGPVVMHAPSPTVRTQIEEMVSVFASNGIFRTQHLTHLLNCVLISVLEQGSPASDAARDISPIVRESISYMLTDPARPITLETLAARAGVTKTYFSRLFHADTGVGFKSYLTSLRIEYAKRLLEEKELSVLDISYECGFNTPSQFVRAFRQYTGRSPSQYRQSTRQE